MIIELSTLVPFLLQSARRGVLKMNNSHNLTPPYDQYSLPELREEIKKRGLKTHFKSSDRSEHAHLVAMPDR